jgi:hypothetical protein
MRCSLDHEIYLRRSFERTTDIAMADALMVGEIPIYMLYVKDEPSNNRSLCSFSVS